MNFKIKAKIFSFPWSSMGIYMVDWFYSFFSIPKVKIKIYAAIAIFCLAFISGIPAHAAENSTPVSVFVSILPQAYFVERIGGDSVIVDVMVKPGKSPATYAPTPAQMTRLAKAKIFFSIGAPFENALMPKIKNIAGQLEIVDTSAGILLRKMQGTAHDAGANDPHIWMSPMLVKKQAKIICDALIRLDPDKKARYQANFKTFASDLDALDEKIKKALAPVKGGTIFVFHPAYGYFADAYGLRQMAVEIQGKAPKGKYLSQFIKKAKKQNVRVIFVQPQFDRVPAQNIARAINGAVICLDPLAKDYLRNFANMADNVARALGN